MAKTQDIKIVRGLGNAPIVLEWQEGDDIETVLKRADITLEKHETATLGRRRILKPKGTDVKPGDTIVIAQKVSNG